jgi:hypothetical protein
MARLGMPKRSSKPDLNQLAVSMVSQATADAKNAAAVALGRIGGLKGGRARAAALSASKRRSIAKRAARARWLKSKD